PAPAPFSSIRGVVLKPGCVLPAMVTGPVRVGRAEVRLIVLTPEPAILNVMVSAPTAALAPRRAARKLPAPPSLMLVTGKVAGARGCSRGCRQGGTGGGSRDREGARRTEEKVRGTAVSPGKGQTHDREDATVATVAAPDAGDNRGVGYCTEKRKREASDISKR